SHADTLTGDDAANHLNGGAGHDHLRSGTGNDMLIGGEGRDTFVFSSGHGNDTITDFADGSDLIQITASGVGFGDLTITNEGTDTDPAAVITWDGGTITLNGVAHTALTAGDFILDEAEVAPKPEPGPAPDQEPAAPKPPYKVIAGNGNNNSLTGTNGRDSINGFAGNDKLIGRRDDDVLTGGSGDDSLIGNTGNDTLRGNLGDDTLIGGHGDDVLTGGMNADTFVFSSGHGNDTITDFDDGVDLIQITASGVGFDDLAIASEGTDTESASVITWDGGRRLCLLRDAHYNAPNPARARGGPKRGLVLAEGARRLPPVKHIRGGPLPGCKGRGVRRRRGPNIDRFRHALKAHWGFPQPHCISPVIVP
ncbi:MAG: calcium-binding protein, partial [Rhodobacteraceae bacterium]|nr:calcium-binding protein [Paracoccaceae bacterium]